MSPIPKYSLSEIEFETEIREAKGASTEDAGLKILADISKISKKQIFVIERPSPSSVGEFDAICCTDSGIIIVELKRYGGCFWPFDILDEQACIQTSRQDKWIPNPSFRLSQKTKKLIQECLNDEGWLRVKRIFSGNIPIYNVVCYGPSTSFDKVPDNDGKNYICNTRNLKKTIWDIFTSKAAVVGAGAQMASMVSTWVQWGVLTTNQKGFRRCSISKISSSHCDASAWGLQSIQSDGKYLSLAYENGRKAKLPFDGEVWIKAYVERMERTVQIDIGYRFRWRIKGR